MEKEVIIFIVVLGLIAAVLYFIGIKYFFKTYIRKLTGKKNKRTQPLTATTLNVGDALLIKERRQWDDFGSSSVVKTYYEVKERKPSSIIFVRKDDSTLELSYPQVDWFISNGVIMDY